ncbi:predicted protein, partial [Nematostella vectensis]
FPDASISEFPTVTMATSLTEFTICSWYSIADKWSDRTIVSYITGDNSSELEVTIRKDGRVALTINWKTVVVPPIQTLPLSGWHHFCLVWGASDGKLELFSDRASIGSQTFASLESVTIHGGGRLVIGQAQRCMGGCFNGALTYHGNLTQVNLWN